MRRCSRIWVALCALALLPGCAPAPSSIAPSASSARASPGVVQCAAGAPTPAAEPAECADAFDRFARNCATASMEGPACPMATLGLLRAGACSSTKARAICGGSLPTKRCDGSVLPGSGEIILTVHRETSPESEVGAGVVALAADGKGLLLGQLAGSSNLAIFKTKVGAGSHSFDVYLAYSPHQTFKGAASLLSRCAILRPDKPLHVDVRITDGGSPVITPVLPNLTIE